MNSVQIEVRNETSGKWRPTGERFAPGNESRAYIRNATRFMDSAVAPQYRAMPSDQPANYTFSHTLAGPVLTKISFKCDECGSTKRDMELSGIADPICCETVI